MMMGPILTIADATLNEGADGVTDKMQFTVTAFPAPDAEITATWTTADETGSETDKYATAGTDYVDCDWDDFNCGQYCN